ncbi:MAG: SufD family Fe-S cluster assembly protein [Clostridia bacterium]|nr:SufD family Fe-S cluster assembly protein [Clostridia bacterium]
MLERYDFNLLDKIADLSYLPENTAYNIRKNGLSAERKVTETVDITTKTDKPGIDITIKPFAKDETVHIPVIITESGHAETVYNDFYIGEGAVVTIIAGCGIHNSGCDESRHDGVHRFFIGKNAQVKYVEKHYGDGDGTGGKMMNPATKIYMESGSLCEMESVQIRGIDSTKRTTDAVLADNARLVVTERLMTHGEQVAESEMTVELNGSGASAQIISRSVAKDTSSQVFFPNAVGNAACRAHIQCDSILMDNAKIRSVPAITANHPDAQIVHEAAIGRINNDQLLKLMTFGIDEQEAENIIIEGFLK